jgi:hypothetical protein
VERRRILRVEQDGIVDEANQVAIVRPQGDTDKSAEGMVGGDCWYFDFTETIDLTDVIGVEVGSNDFANHCAHSTYPLVAKHTLYVSMEVLAM